VIFTRLRLGAYIACSKQSNCLPVTGSIRVLEMEPLSVQAQAVSMSDGPPLRFDPSANRPFASQEHPRSLSETSSNFPKEPQNVGTAFLPTLRTALRCRLYSPHSIEPMSSRCFYVSTGSQAKNEQAGCENIHPIFTSYQIALRLPGAARMPRNTAGAFGDWGMEEI